MEIKYWMIGLSISALVALVLLAKSLRQLWQIHVTPNAGKDTWTKPVLQHSAKARYPDFFQRYYTAPLIIINLIADHGKSIRGLELISLIQQLNLQFGPLNIFHCLAGQDRQEHFVYSMASLIEPGFFDLNQMAEQNYLGVSLFMPRSQQVQTLNDFDCLVRAAKFMAHALNVNICNEHRQVLDRRGLEQLRLELKANSQKSYPLYG